MLVDNAIARVTNYSASLSTLLLVTMVFYLRIQRRYCFIFSRQHFTSIMASLSPNVIRSFKNGCIFIENKLDLGVEPDFDGLSKAIYKL